MKKLLIIITTFLLLMVSYSISFSSLSEIRARITNFGIMKVVNEETEINNQLLAGKKHLSNNWSFIKRTSTISDKIGIEFGLEYQIQNAYRYEFIEVEEVMIFPEDGLTNPDTKMRSKFDIEKLKIDPSEIQFFSYQFEDEWERKKGKWIFQVRYQGKILAEKVFTIE